MEASRSRVLAATATHAGEIVGMLWMETFYREAARAPLPEAARRAASAVKARPEYVHPYYWGAFFLVGR